MILYLKTNNWLKKFINLIVVWRFSFRLTPFKTALGHWLQGTGFPPECALMCCFKFLDTETALRHWLQLNGFSPECVLKFAFKLLDIEKDFDCKEMGVSRGCVFKCIFK